MAETPGVIPSPHEPFITLEQPAAGAGNSAVPQGRITRTWWRVLNGLNSLSGKLAAPIVVPKNSVFNEGTLNSGGTLTPTGIASGTLLGNSSGIDEAASSQSVDSTLRLEGGELGIATIGAVSLLGNAGSVAAQPSGIGIGAGLTVTATNPPTLAVVGGGGSGPPGTTDLTAAQLLSWWRQ